jgi:hypothetical protein
LFGWIIFREILTLKGMFGAGLILLSGLISEYPFKRTDNRHQTSDFSREGKEPPSPQSSPVEGEEEIGNKHELHE